MTYVEFKHNNSNPEDLGEYISALSNSAALKGKPKAYLLFGIQDITHAIVGTQFIPSKEKILGQELENWILTLLKPKVNFRFFELFVENLPIVLLEIDAACSHPVQFKNQEFIRVGSYKKKLRDHPEKERQLWRVFDQTSFERMIALENASTEQVLALLDYPAYFELLKQPLPDSRSRILEAFEKDGIIVSNLSKTWN